ncbi:hypothetical protein BH09ACT8_BH09ACT8_35020 [soil metagenome]
MTSNRTGCSRAAIVFCIVGALIAAAAAVPLGRFAFDQSLINFTFGGKMWVVDHRKLLWDLAFIACYGAALLLCGWVFRGLAISKFGTLMAEITIVAVLVTMAADLAEDGFLWFAQAGTWLQHAAGAAATVKWSAAIIAVLAVPAAVLVVGRLLWTSARFRFAKTGDPQTGKPWWESVIAKADAPEFADSNDRDLVLREQGSWAKAYRVPGTAEVLQRSTDRGEPTTAICLSGGGVRSACVAMGATQEFAERGHRDGGGNLLDNVDYIISVSGGGYTAGARLLSNQPMDQSPTLTPVWKRRKARKDATEDEPWKPLKLSQRYSDGSPEFDYLRRHSSYIADSPGGLVVALGEVLKNLLASLVALFWIPVALGFVVGLFYVWQPLAAFVPTSGDAASKAGGNSTSLTGNAVAWSAVVVFVVAAAALQTLAMVMEWLGVSSGWEWFRERFTVAANGAALFGMVTLAVTMVIPGLMKLCANLDLGTGGHVGGIAGVVGLQYLVSVGAMVWRKKSVVMPKKSGGTQWAQRIPRAIFQYGMVLLTLTVLAALWLLVLGSVAESVFASVIGSSGALLTAVPHWLIWVLALGGIALFLGIADVTSLSLHPFYRGRLARTFAVRRLQIRGMQRWRAQRYAGSEATWLDAYGTVKDVDASGIPCPDETAPHFVFAAAAPISGDEKAAPGLNAVSFVMTADYVGGPELGWLKTPELIRIAPPRLRRDLTVQAAVAVSGAAFASAMGRQSSWASTLLAVSGARLGTWLPNPFFVRRLVGSLDDDVQPALARGVSGEQHARELANLRADMESAKSATSAVDTGDNVKIWPKGLPTMRGNGYFYRELLGLHKKGGRLLQVTDGGHYENLGLVEALRRRCQLIYCVDASGDTPPLVTGLSDAIRLAECELGVSIKVREGQGETYTLANLAPGSGEQFVEPDGFTTLNKRITRQALLVADITYPEAAGLDKSRRHGVLIVAKAVLWRECPPWLLTYAAAKENAIFPHDPTSDQWFNESQFSAYTELGRLIGGSAVKAGKAEYDKLIARYAPARRPVNVDGGGSGVLGWPHDGRPRDATAPGHNGSGHHHEGPVGSGLRPDRSGHQHRRSHSVAVSWWFRAHRTVDDAGRPDAAGRR